jgi:hypothetical protein
LALAVALSRFTPRVGGGSAFFVSRPEFICTLKIQMWDLIIFLGYVGWFLAGVVLVALFMQHSAHRKKEKRDAPTDKEQNTK